MVKGNMVGVSRLRARMSAICLMITGYSCKHDDRTILDNKIDVANGATADVEDQEKAYTSSDIPAAQAALCFANLSAILAEAGLGPSHVVRLNAFVTGREHMAGYMEARDAFLAGMDPMPASTLMIVSGFSRPEFLVEVEALAAEDD